MSSTTHDPGLLEAVLDSWDRANRITVNLLRLVPGDGLAARATDNGPTVAQMFTHLHYVRLAFIAEDAPEFARDVPAEEWVDGRDRDEIARMLNESASAVRQAVHGRLEAGRPMERHYDHPVLFLQHMLWHEGYHHGQVKLALKLNGQPIPDEAAGPGTWGVFLRKTR